MARLGMDEAIRIIHSCAVLYDKNLSYKNVMFITAGKNGAAYFETQFHPQNFLHLTGVKTSLNSEFFYKSALNQRLSSSNIGFDPGGTTERKLEILHKLMSIHATARMVGDYDNSRPLLVADKLAGTVTMAMGFTLVNGIYIPSTALKLDMRQITEQATRRKIAAILVKSCNDSLYKHLSYISKDMTIDDDVLAPILKEKADVMNLTADFPIPRKPAE